MTLPSGFQIDSFLHMKKNSVSRYVYVCAPFRSTMHYELYNEDVIKERLCFDLARNCINSYFEQLNGSSQQMQSGIYHQLFMFFTFPLSFPLIHLPPPHTHKHTQAHKHTLHTWLCTSAQPSDVLGGAADAHTIAFSVRQKLAKENGSFRHFVCVF